jgi:hypothetical protein
MVSLSFTFGGDGGHEGYEGEEREATYKQVENLAINQILVALANLA